jgi:hypothetical protein
MSNSVVASPSFHGTASYYFLALFLFFSNHVSSVREK